MSSTPTAAAGALVYGNTLHGPFLFDDLHSIVHNADVDAAKTSVWPLFGQMPRHGKCNRVMSTCSAQSVGPAAQLSGCHPPGTYSARTPSMTSHTSMQSYRPLTVLSFRINHSLHGMAPFGFHLVNVALHSIVRCATSTSCRVHDTQMLSQHAFCCGRS